MEFAWSRRPTGTVVRFCDGTGEVAASAAAGRTFALVDRKVAELWDLGCDGLGLDAGSILLLDAVEENKSPRTLEYAWKRMSDAGITRDSVILGIGGGLTLDVAALAASTWHRGTGLVLVPTTVLAMADACLGGKTAVNLAGAKNQVGTFYPADEVLIAECFVNTLPPREYRNGLAEVLKAGLIGDREIGGLLAEPPPRDGDHRWLRELVERSLRVKGRIVSADLTESGHRRVLNLGHTLGHALESVSGFDLSHGEAVGIGMVAASVMAGAESLTAEIRELLLGVGLPAGTGAVSRGQADIEAFLVRDKKTSEGVRTWVLPHGWEDCRLRELGAEEERDLLRKALDAISTDR
jgi:3-dehydroquinate synthetase